MVREIRQCMLGLDEAGEDRLTARFSFPAGFVGFQGHFPERPVLPAVCKIQAAITMLEAWSGRRVRLNEIVLAKFANPVTVDEEVVFVCTVIKESADRRLVKATVAKKGENIGKFRFRISFED